MNLGPATAVGGASFARGAWVAGPNELSAPAVASDAVLPQGAPRVARASRITRLGALVVGRAVHGLPACDPDRVTVVGATALASLRTNLRFEHRRIQTGRAIPRDFAFTAPNAWVGEVAATIDARGPSTCVVGPHVAVDALAAACRWLDEGACDRAVVVAAESPPDDRSSLTSEEEAVFEGAAAIVLERLSQREKPSILVSWNSPPGPHPMASTVEVLATLWFSARDGTHLAVDGSHFRVEALPAP